MDSVKYELADGKLNINNGVIRFTGYTYEAVQDSLDYCIIHNATPINIQFWRDALAFMRANLTLEAATARYASDVQCTWARMGCRGGTL